MATESIARHATRSFVVAVNATGACSETLDTAALLAAAEGAELEVVFVEDANLLRLADLPVTHEIDRTSGAIREIDTRRVLRALEVEARRLRREVERIGSTRAVRSTLRVARGHIFSEALSASARVEVTFVHAAARAFAGDPRVGHRPTSKSATRRGGVAHGARRQPVCCLYEGGPDGARALATAAKLAKALECRLMVLIPCHRAEEAEARARELATRIEEIELRFFEVAENRSAFEAGVLVPRASRLLVVAKTSPSLQGEAARRALESLPLPLVLVA